MKHFGASTRIGPCDATAFEVALGTFFRFRRRGADEVTRAHEVESLNPATSFRTGCKHLSGDTSSAASSVVAPCRSYPDFAPSGI